LKLEHSLTGGWAKKVAIYFRRRKRVALSPKEPVKTRDNAAIRPHRKRCISHGEFPFRCPRSRFWGAAPGVSGLGMGKIQSYKRETIACHELYPFEGAEKIFAASFLIRRFGYRVAADINGGRISTQCDQQCTVGRQGSRAIDSAGQKRVQDGI